MDGAPPAPMVVSTDMLPERERFDAWRETFALRLARVDVTTPDRARFRAAIGMRPLERLSLITIAVGPVGLLRTKELVRDGNDDVSLVICTSGTAEARFNDHSVTVGCGDATLVAHNYVGGITTNVPTGSLSFCLPRALWRELLGRGDLPLLRPIARHNSALRLLSGYVGAVAANDGLLTPAAAGLIDRHMCELLAHLFDPNADVARGEHFGGIRAARLQAILDRIDRNLANPDLSAATIGAMFGLSERYVHHLLAPTGMTFSQLVRQKRLERARRMLEDRSLPARRIVDIAYAVGFSDLSHFNHSFRKHFGRTPSDVRRGG